MTILQIITKSELGGAQSVVSNLSNNLVEKHKVIVVAGEGDGKFFEDLDNRITKIHCKSLVRAISPIKELKTLWAFWKIYRQFRPDIIHLHSSKVGLLGRLIFPSSKIFYTVHGFDSIRIAFRKFLPLERLLQNNCQSIIGVSKYDCNNLASEKISHNVNLVYNGIKDCSLPETELLRSIPDRYKYRILCIARLSPQKNSTLFMEVAKHMSDVAFVWIGNLETVETNLENVFFWGNVPHSGYQCRFFDVFMLPSNYEGLPIVILEAMSCALPIVASDVGGVSEIVRNGENGYVLPNKVEAFVEKLYYILNHPDVRKSMGLKSRQIYLDSHSDKAMTEKYINLYGMFGS